MWQVRDLDILMPVGIHVYEDSDSVMIHCLWCGDELRYARGGPGADKLVSDARTHRENCQARRWAIETTGPLNE